MILAQAVGLLEIIVVLLYLLVIGYLGWLGYRKTKTAADYMLAGRKTHPFVMAMSYGATFISTSAIVGFGGVAGMFGMSLLWLTFLNIFVGIFIAFVFLGPRTRRMGHRLDAHTFPELMGRRYQSRFVQVFAGLIIFIFMPLYSAAVLIGGSEFIRVQFGIDYGVALLVFSVVVAGYVIAGGLKGVMYTDALQGSIMFVGMVVLLIWTYAAFGGVNAAHEQLGKLGELPSLFKDMGFRGWESMPQAGWGGPQYDLWWIVVSTIVMGVGIGVLAQPQLAVRFMTVKSKRELNRAVLVGGIFILIMTGVAFTVGSLANAYFYNRERLTGTVVEKIKTAVILKEERDLVKKAPVEIWRIDTTGNGMANVNIIGQAFDVTTPAGQVVPFSKLLPKAEITATLADGRVEIAPRATAFARGVNQRADGQWWLNTDTIIPTFISASMPKWFGLLFLLTLLAAAMSTLSSQFHTLGTGIGRDVYGQFSRRESSIGITRIGIIVGILLAVLISFYARGGYIVARATAIFFGLCASAFLPTFVGGLYFRWVTRAGAIASMIVGSLVTAFWLLFIKDAEARALGLCFALFKKHSLLLGQPNWPVVDPIFVALPLSLLTMLVVSLLTRRPDQTHLERCFQKSAPAGR